MGSSGMFRMMNCSAALLPGAVVAQVEVVRVAAGR